MEGFEKLRRSTTGGIGRRMPSKESARRSVRGYNGADGSGDGDDRADDGDPTEPMKTVATKGI